MMQEPFLENGATAQPQRNVPLEQENAMLRSQLANYQKQVETLHPRMVEMEAAYALLAAEVANYRRQEQAWQAIFTASEQSYIQLLSINQPLQKPDRDVQQSYPLNAELQQSQTRLQDLLRTMSDWAWEVDANGIYTYVDEKVYQFLGYLPEELLGKTPFDFMPPQEAVRVAQEFSQIATAQRPFRKLENLNLAKDGHPVIFETSGTPIFDLQGNFLGYRGIDSDITERKRAEEALKQSETQLAQKATELQQAIDRLTLSEERYRTLFELSSDGIYRWELDQPMPVSLPIEEQVDWFYRHFRIAEANTAYAAMYGFTKVVGLQLSSEAYQSSLEQKLSLIRGFIASGYRMCDAELEEVDRQGNRRYFLNNGMGIIKDGHLVEGWGTQIDITELRETQQALLQAEQERVVELAKANAALTRSLNAIAVDANPNQIIGHILKVIAEQFDTSLVEYWLHSDCNRTAYLKLTHWNGEILTPEEQPGHPGINAFPSLLSLICPNDLGYPASFLIDDIATDRAILAASAQIGIDINAWYQARGVSRLLNIPLRLNDKTVGALDIWLPDDRHFSNLQIELGYAFAQQTTLAVYLNQLFEEAKQTAIFEERNRLAGEIHDTLAQSFTGIAVQLELAKFLVEQNPSDVTTTLDRIGELAKTGLAEARRSVWTLYPADEDYADLAQKLSHCLTQMTSGTSLHTGVTLHGEPYPLLPFIGKNLLRIGQEAITNTLKYAQATHLWIELIYVPDGIRLTIQDDGCGFDPKAPSDGFGLIGMSERADRVGGQLIITTQPNQGTKIDVQVPLTHSSP